jgi:small subunit ribosomal protein S16
MRMGKKKQPTYRVVAADGRAPRNGRFIEILGAYDPRHEPSKVSIDVAKADEWIAKGAQPTERVAKLLAYARTLPTADEAAEGAAAAPAEAPAES